VAAIVQKMIPSEISGVAFSVHPVTNNKSHMVIESIKGLGEKLVSGLTTPDTHVLDKQTQKVIEKYLATGLPFLSTKQLRELATKVIKIEEFFGFPVDVEWAFAGKELFILQSRPITTLS
jgi:phosphoenolpyruvate synthase/pyruvate phosphate dikinase